MNENQYMWDQDEETELARLIQQSNLFDQAIKDLLPPSIDPDGLHRVLDVGCGPGGWVMGLAQLYPHCHVVGIDVSSHMIAYAKAQARVRRIENVEFQVMDIFHPAFPDATFDAINMRFGISFLNRESWIEFLKICHRLLRPGGTLVVFEGESSISNSAATARLQQWTSQVMHQLGKAFGHGYSAGIVAMLETFFQKAGFENVQAFPYCINSSMGSEMHAMSMQTMMNMSNQLQGSFTTLLNIPPETVLETSQAVQMEMKQDQYCSVTFFLSVVGTTPDHS